jgi:hypothetical protein
MKIERIAAPALLGDAAHRAQRLQTAARRRLYVAVATLLIVVEALIQLVLIPLSVVTGNLSDFYSVGRMPIVMGVCIGVAVIASLLVALIGSSPTELSNDEGARANPHWRDLRRWTTRLWGAALIFLLTQIVTSFSLLATEGHTFSTPPVLLVDWGKVPTLLAVVFLLAVLGLTIVSFVKGRGTSTPHTD